MGRSAGPSQPPRRGWCRDPTRCRADHKITETWFLSRRTILETRSTHAVQIARVVADPVDEGVRLDVGLGHDVEAQLIAQVEKTGSFG